MKKKIIRHALAAAVSGDIKRRVNTAAAAELITPSAWLRRVTIRALACQPSAIPDSTSNKHSADLRDDRISVRVSPDDALLLKERALARGMRPATYASVLVRSHLRSISPLPKDELLALRCAISELGALARDIHRMVQALGSEGRAAPSEQPDLQAVVRLCQTLRSDTKALVQANVNSWEIGYPTSASVSRQAYSDR